MLQALLRPSRPGSLALGLLTLAAIAVGLAGIEHARLFHRGYDHVEIVGPLFILNAIGSMIVIAMLVLQRVWLFVLGALSIVVPSLVSIYISHTSGFFGFREGGYDEATTLIVAAELAASALLALGAGATFIALRRRAGDSATMSPVRVPLAALVVVVMGAAIVGIGMGQAPAAKQAAPSTAELAAAKQRIAAGGATVRNGRATFEDEGCDRCHAIAAIDAEGRLGPRLDRLDDDGDDIIESIVEPREDTVDGYSEELMPTDFAERLDRDEVRALAAFVAAAAGTADEDGDNSGRGGGNSGEGGGDSGSGGDDSRSGGEDSGGSDSGKGRGSSGDDS